MENVELSSENILLDGETNEENNENTILVEDSEETVVSLDTIHYDLGVICSFLIFFVLVILLKYVYKFFDMFFTI